MADRVALITGGTRGIGLGIARTLAAEGWSLALNGQRSPEQVSEVAAELEALGVPVLYVPADISIAAERERLIAGVRERFGHLDALVNNAGVGPNVRAELSDAGEESFERWLRINLNGAVPPTQAVASGCSKTAPGDPEPIAQSSLSLRFRRQRVG